MQLLAGVPGSAADALAEAAAAAAQLPDDVLEQFEQACNEIQLIRDRFLAVYDDWLSSRPESPPQVSDSRRVVSRQKVSLGRRINLSQHAVKIGDQCMMCSRCLCFFQRRVV